MILYYRLSIQKDGLNLSETGMSIQKKAGTPVGIISLIKRSYLEYFDIGFAFLPQYTNNGYAYEASKAILAMVSRLPAFKTVLATTLSSNKSSIKLLAKLGFRFEKENEKELNNR